MPSKRRVVVQHLEGLSGHIFETHPQVLRELIRRRAGIYALYRREQLYYVGLASNLMARLKHHLRDKHRGAWDRFSVYLTVHDDHMKELESLLLRIVGPKGNKQRGRFMNSKNLAPTLNRLVTEADADRRASLLGGHVATRRRRRKAKAARGALALAGLVDRRTPLRAERNGWEYYASLRKDGRIRYDGELYDTPNAAARAALGQPHGGWRFWKYRDRSGEWVPLRNLKR